MFKLLKGMLEFFKNKKELLKTFWDIIGVGEEQT